MKDYALLLVAVVAGTVAWYVWGRRSPMEPPGAALVKTSVAQADSGDLRFNFAGACHPQGNDCDYCETVLGAKGPPWHRGGATRTESDRCYQFWNAYQAGGRP